MSSIFEACFHSMVVPDCPGCLYAHYVRTMDGHDPLGIYPPEESTPTKDPRIGREYTVTYEWSGVFKTGICMDDAYNCISMDDFLLRARRELLGGEDYTFQSEIGPSKIISIVKEN